MLPRMYKYEMVYVFYGVWNPTQHNTTQNETKRNIQRHNMILCHSRYHLNTLYNHDYCRNLISISHTTLLLHSTFGDILKLAKSHYRYINLSIVYPQPFQFHIPFLFFFFVGLVSAFILVVGTHI